MKKIMILGASLLQIPAIIRAKEMGLQVIVCDMNPDAIGFKEKGVIKEIISTMDADVLLECAKKHKIDGVLTICTDQPMKSVARIASELGLPGISEWAAYTATNKAAMRKCLSEHGVPCPKFVRVETKEEYMNAVKQFKEKAVVKAVDNAGSRGIELVDLNDRDAVDKAYDYCKEWSHSGELVLEEYMDGPEVCVETLSIDGVCYTIQITDQLRKLPPYFTDAGYNQPSMLPLDVQEEIRKVVIDANMALQNYHGSSCTEIIVTKDGPKVVEVGPRLAGDCMTTHLVPLSTGVDMVTAVINIALGEPVDHEQKFTKGSCIRYFMKPVVGKIKEIRGVDEISKMDGVVQVTLVKNIGDMAVPLRGSGDRIGFIITQKDTPEEAIKCCDAALEKLEDIVE